MGYEFNIDFSNRKMSIPGILNDGFTLKDVAISYADKDNALNGVMNGIFNGEIKSGNSIPVIDYHIPHFDSIVNIIVVGAGGTGGYLIRDLARFIYSVQQDHSDLKIELTIIDGDIVEEKNLIRQNFIKQDIGKYKAEVLAERYSAAFGIEISAVTEMLTDINAKNRIFSSYNNNYCNIVVGCVDNNQTRRIIHNALRNKKIYWLDAGNERKSGQIVLGMGSGYRGYGDDLFSSHHLPYVTDIYPEILDPLMDDTDKTISCAERSLADAQNIFVNLSAATYLLNFLRQLILKEKISLSSLEFNIKGITQVKYLTSDFFKNINGV